jgi:hypothetical protein
VEVIEIKRPDGTTIIFRKNGAAPEAENDEDIVNKL